MSVTNLNIENTRLATGFVFLSDFHSFLSLRTKLSAAFEVLALDGEEDQLVQ